MEIRKKNDAIRIAPVAWDGRPSNVPYVLIEPSECWCSTFNAWGKKSDAPIIEVGGKSFRVTLEPLSE